MKAFLTTFIFSILLVTFSPAQDFPLVEAGTLLTYGSGAWSSDYGYNGSRFFINEDTLINGVNYHKVDRRESKKYMEPDSVFKNEFSLRQDGDKVFLINDDLDDEVLLYDFGLELLDTFNYYKLDAENIDPDLFEFVVTEVDSFIDYTGISRKRITLSSAIYNSIGLGYLEQDVWVEGYGSLKRFATDLYLEGDTLICFLQGDDFEISQNDYFCDQSVVTSSNVVDDNILVQLSPNPVSTQLTIQTQYASESNLIITDPLGRVMHTQLFLGSNSIVIDVSNYHEGLYYLQLQRKNGSQKTSIFIIQH